MTSLVPRLACFSSFYSHLRPPTPPISISLFLIRFTSLHDIHQKSLFHLLVYPLPLFLHVLFSTSMLYEAECKRPSRYIVGSRFKRTRGSCDGRKKENKNKKKRKKERKRKKKDRLECKREKVIVFCLKYQRPCLIPPSPSVNYHEIHKNTCGGYIFKRIGDVERIRSTRGRRMEKYE